MQNRTPSRPPDHEALPDFTPVSRQRKRHDGWTPARQKAFIEALASTGSVKAAAASVNMAPEGAYQLRRQAGAEEFAAAWDAVMDDCVLKLRDALMDRALNGVEHEVFSYGKSVGTRRLYNDRLGQFMLSNHLGAMSAGASGPPLIVQRLIDQAVAQARAQWEDERRQQSAGSTDRMRQLLDTIDERLRQSEEEQEWDADDEESGEGTEG